MMSQMELETHYRMVIKALTDGKVVPFLGAGVNLCGRPQDAPFEPGKFLPSGMELAAHLAATYGYPSSDLPDLVRVSQYIAVMSGLGPLYDELHTLFSADYPFNIFHRFFAALPARLRAKGYVRHYPIYISTNYDDVLESAFREAKEPFDLLLYIADGESRGRFLHQPMDGPACLIDRPNEYRGIPVEQRTIIVKIHGAVNRTDPDADSYVITEDHYIDYLTRTDLNSILPATLTAKLRKSHFLFLGYGLRDWNLRVILHRIWGTQILTYKSWAIQLNPQPIDQEFWQKRAVEIFNIPLEEYINELDKRVEKLPAINGAGGGAP